MKELNIPSDERNQLIEDAFQRIQVLRRHEEDVLTGLTESREALDYAIELMGVAALFYHVRLNLPKGTQRIVDVGAGDTRAAKALQDSMYGRGTEVYATVLHRRKEIDNHLGFGHTIETSAEEMSGFSPESVGGIIACNSLPFSRGLPLVAEKLSDVLVGNGAIKASFPHEPRFHRLGDNNYIPLATHHKFTDTLRELGFGVSVNHNKDYNKDVVVAIKDGSDYEANDLFQEEFRLGLYRNQLKMLGKKQSI